MELQGDQRKQLHQILLKFKFSKLKELAEFALDKHLEEISISQDLSEVVLELIHWAEAQNYLPEFINGALERNLRNETLQELAAQFPLPQTPPEPTTPPQPPPETRTPAEAADPIEQPAETPNEPVDINTKRHLRSASKGEEEESHQESGEPSSVPPIPFPLKEIAELRNHVNAAREFIQNVYNIFSPEKEVFRDQCLFATGQIKAAEDCICKNCVDNVYLIHIHSQTCSLLKLERTYFCTEASKMVAFLQEFANQISSLPLRKKIWEKLQSLMKSLQDSNSYIDTLLEDTQTGEVDN